MATQESAKTAESKADATESKAQAAINTTIENMIVGQEKLAETLEAASKRSLRVGEEIMATVIAGQRDVVDLSKTIATEPQAYAKNMDALMNTVIGFQQRSLDVAKILYREQSDAADNAKNVWGPMFASTEQMRTKFKEMSAAWVKPFSA